MIIESIVLGSITLTYKPPQPPVEAGREIPKIKQIEPLPDVKVKKLYKIQPKPKKTVTRAVRGSNGLNGYTLGQCTAWVASKRFVPSGWGDASNWKDSALRAGWTVSSTPVVGAIGWTYKHVVYVESVNGSTVTISEQNYDWNSGIRTATFPISKYTYIY